jgi:multidrug efflux pump subunit AcrB
MAQFGRPSADTLRDNWEEDDGTTTDIFDQIDESSVDDADYIRTVQVPTNDVYVTKLSNVTDPLQSSGHVVRYRYGKDQSGGAQIDLTVQLRQGYTNEGAPGTLIKEWTHTNISNTLTTATQTLSGAEADSISDYTSLYLRFVGNQV